MKRWILSALLAGFVVTLASCGDCDKRSNDNRGCRRCAKCTSMVDSLDTFSK